MRDWRQFSKTEWLGLAPLGHAIKEIRNDWAQNIFLKRLPAALPDFLRANAHLRDKNIVLIAAFEQPWALDFLLRQARLHLPDASVLVFDNSRKTAVRPEIERVCREHEIPYLALPPSPGRHPNRSHGMALTWIFKNVVCALKPRRFAFIDHDLIPLATMEFSKLPAGQPFYGAIRGHPYENPHVIGKWGWSLWAGYCIYDFSAVGGLPLNFLTDVSLELDTGGRNWQPLYRNYDRHKIQLAEVKMSTMPDPITREMQEIQIIDGRWLHLRGASYSQRFQARMDFYRRLAQGLGNGEITASSLLERVQ